MTVDACEMCLRRSWLLGELAGHLDPVRSRIAELLALGDEELISAVAGRRRDLLHRRFLDFDPAEVRRGAERAGVELLCCCDPSYPVQLRAIPSAPAALHIAGGAERFLAAVASETVAIVGSRAASTYGTNVAHSLARGLSAAGVPVISGMACGIDSAAHHGALSVAGPTVAVLPGPATEPYPRAARRLYRQVLKTGFAISEMPSRAPVRSWMFLARNRIIAGLAAMTVVVEAGRGSGALLTARHATDLGRLVGAVPGRITAPQAAGPNRLIQNGDHLVTGAQDVLDLLFEAGTRKAPADDRPQLSRELRSLLTAIEAGHDTPAALVREGILADQGLAALASLELAGYVRRGTGGRFTIVP